MKATQIEFGFASQTAAFSIYVSPTSRISAEGSLRVLRISDVPVFRFDCNNSEENAIAVAMLLNAGSATKAAIARAIGISRHTVYRIADRMKSGGIAEVVRRANKGPNGPSKIDDLMQGLIVSMKGKELSNVEIGTRLGIDERSVRRVLRLDGVLLAWLEGTGG